MKLYSTNSKNKFVSLKTAILKGLADDNGLFMPKYISKLPKTFFDEIEKLSFRDLSFLIAKNFIGTAIPDTSLKTIIDNSITFDAPLVSLNEKEHILELFHGPSLAFKDFGARFMAQIMGYFNTSNEILHILVATSGDTGGAVAAGFFEVPGINVTILYPKGKVSILQEKQLTTFGKNIKAIEVNGTFDDCQALVKQGFLDQDLNSKLRLSSANSINIARLIPQSFYYFEAYKQLKDKKTPFVFTIPSGNFGNLTAGLFAKEMGLPVHKFIAATNENDIVPHYLSTGNYKTKASVSTISNAMDVGSPSNYARMEDLMSKNKNCSTWNNFKSILIGYKVSEKETIDTIEYVFNEYKYIIEPHGGVGVQASRYYRKNKPKVQTITLETAHPSKFLEVMPEKIGKHVNIPERLKKLENMEGSKTTLENSYVDFKSFLTHNYL